MYKFIFEDEDRPCPYGITDPYHTKRIEFQVRDNSDLDEMLDAFENFLKANGFNFDGNVDIVPKHSFDNTDRNSIDDAKPMEWNNAYKNVKVTYK
jgi:hypothetical protein